jgi:DNA-binding PadR family transcriptional regulator
MKTKERRPLPDSAFVVLGLIAEGETHGYNIQKVVHNRGFQFWTSLKRSSAYNALVLLEEDGLIKSEKLPGEGPEKKVYHITDAGKQRLVEDGVKHLSSPANAKSEIDLGIYVLPLLPKKNAREGLSRCLEHLNARKGFLEERLRWCKDRKLALPALAFERPLLVLKAEIEWLKRVKDEFKSSARLKSDDWQKYEFREPPVKEDE